MRRVALALAILTLVAAAPHVGATDECTSDNKCTATGPAPSQAPQCLPAPAQATCLPQGFYVYGAAATCSTNACKGSPPAHVIGIVWQETNGIPGLQRTTANGHPADTVLLY